MSNIIKISNFLSLESCEKYASFIEDHLDSFKLSDDRTKYPEMRYTIRFGFDDEFPELCHQDLSSVSEIESDLQDLISRTANQVSQSFGEPDLVLLTSFFLSKHVPGSVLPPHMDSGESFNPQLDYVALVYLNSLDDSGYLYFRNSNNRVDVKAGDLVIFPCKGEEYMHEVPDINADRYSIPMWFTKDRAFEFKV